jgi:hypothetical protein
VYDRCHERAACDCSAPDFLDSGELCADGGGRLVTVPFDEPVLVVARQEGEQRDAQVFDGREVLHPEELFP